MKDPCRTLRIDPSPVMRKMRVTVWTPQDEVRILPWSVTEELLGLQYHFSPMSHAFTAYILMAPHPVKMINFGVN